MATKAKTCYVRAVNGSHLTVHLPNCTEVFIGRCPEANILDTKCSKQQVRLYANYDEYTVTVQQIGKRPCGLNGFKTRKDVKLVAGHNDQLEVLYGKYTYVIEFNPAPAQVSTQTISRKRSYETEELNSSEEKDSYYSYKIQKTDDQKNSNQPNNSDRYSSDRLKNDIRISDVLINANILSMEESNSGVKMPWESIHNGKLLIYSPQSMQHRAKIAAYDMDGTLIKTKSGLVFPKDCNDWEILYPDVPRKLKLFHTDEYKIVIFTNQGKLGNGKVKVEDFKVKIERIVQKLGVPIQVFIAIGDNIYRKPAIGMWNMLTRFKNGGISVDTRNSFYVGDAAGRQKNWSPGKKKDHACADRLMALNIGLRFQTPEEHFLGYKSAAYVLPTFNPKSLPRDSSLCNPSNTRLTLKEQEMILMVGCPGSGKSHFAKFHLKEYEYVNRDTLGSWQKCVTALEELLIQGRSVVVDNTNPDPASRRRYIEVAKRHNVPVRCFVMAVSVEHAKHNNKYRELTDPSHMKIGEMIINSYVKNYVPPSVEEGLQEIIEVNFIPRFTTEQDRTLYEMYLLPN